MINRLHKKNFLSAAVVIGCFFILSCENDEKVLQEWTEKKVMVEEAKDVVSLFSQNGTLRAKLTSP